MKNVSIALLMFVAACTAESKGEVPEAGPKPAAEKKAEAAPAEKPSAAYLALGGSMPEADVEMVGVDGKKLTLGGAKGENGTLVVFTCNHCPYAVAWEERVTALGNAYAGKGFGVVAVNSNDPEAYPVDGMEGMKERAKKLGLEFPYVVDATSNVARAFGATKTPEAFLFDAEGKLVYHGAIDDNAKEPAAVESTYLKDALEEVLAKKPVAKPETKSVGCSIKFRS